MSRRRLLMALGAALLSAAVYFVARGPVFKTVHSNDEARLRALEQKLASLEARLRDRPTSIRGSSSQSHLLVPVAPPAAGEATEAQTASKAAPSVAAAAPVDEVALQREYFGDLDVRLAGEPRDPVWSADTEQKLRAVQDLRPRITIDNARCGQTMCRVEARVAELKDVPAAIDRLISNTASVLPEAVVSDGEAPGHHIVYYARPGSGFPPMNAPEATAQ